MYILGIHVLVVHADDVHVVLLVLEFIFVIELAPTVILLLQMAVELGSSLRCQLPPACPLIFDVVPSLLSAVAYDGSSTWMLSPGMALVVCIPL
jgi:hypothetical protein